MERNPNTNNSDPGMGANTETDPVTDWKYEGKSPGDVVVGVIPGDQHRQTELYYINMDELDAAGLPDEVLSEIHQLINSYVAGEDQPGAPVFFKIHTRLAGAEKRELLRTAPESTAAFPVESDNPFDADDEKLPADEEDTMTWGEYQTISDEFDQLYDNNPYADLPAKWREFFKEKTGYYPEQVKKI